MALPIRDQVKYWGVVALILFLLLWFMGHVLVPFWWAARLPISWIRWPTGWSAQG